MRQPKLIGEPDAQGKVAVDLQYIQNLRNECRERRLHEAELVAEVARLTYILAGPQTADATEVTP